MSNGKTPTWGRFFRGLLVGSVTVAGYNALDYVDVNLAPMLKGSVGAVVGGVMLMLTNFLRDKFRGK
jgi:hypothetical protein